MKKLWENHLSFPYRFPDKPRLRLLEREHIVLCRSSTNRFYCSKPFILSEFLTLKVNEKTAAIKVVRRNCANWCQRYWVFRGISWDEWRRHYGSNLCDCELLAAVALLADSGWNVSFRGLVFPDASLFTGKCILYSPVSAGWARIT